MTILDPEAGYAVLINTFRVKSGQAKVLLAALSNATEMTVRHVPGFVSANFHVSEDGRRVVNYAQWRSKADFEAMTRDPEFRAHTQALAELYESVEPVLYELRAAHGG